MDLVYPEIICHNNIGNLYSYLYALSFWTLLTVYARVHGQFHCRLHHQQHSLDYFVCDGYIHLLPTTIFERKYQWHVNPHKNRFIPTEIVEIEEEEITDQSCLPELKCVFQSHVFYYIPVPKLRQFICSSTLDGFFLQSKLIFHWVKLVERKIYLYSTQKNTDKSDHRYEFTYDKVKNYLYIEYQSSEFIFNKK